MKLRLIVFTKINASQTSIKSWAIEKINWYIAGTTKYEFPCWWFKCLAAIYIVFMTTRCKEFWFRGLVFVVLNKTRERTLNGRSRQFSFKLREQRRVKKRSNNCLAFGIIIWRGKITSKTLTTKASLKEWSLSWVRNVTKTIGTTKKKAWRRYERIWKVKAVYAISIAGILNLNP